MEAQLILFPGVFRIQRRKLQVVTVGMLEGRCGELSRADAMALV